MNRITPELQKAIDMVKKYHPNLAIVYFDRHASWNYTDKDSKGLFFSPEIDVAVLEEAASSIDTLPNVFYLNHNEILQQELVRNMMDYLQKFTELPEVINVNAVSRISDDLDYVEVKYFGTEPDGDRQTEFAKEEPKAIDFDTAVKLLSTRILNSSI